MGKAIQQSVEQTDDMVVAGVWARGSSLAEILAEADVLIDFSLPAANAEVLQAVSKHKIPLVCGVSGLDSDQIAAMRAVAATVPVVFDRNMSQGVTVLDSIVQRVAGSLGPEFSVEIHETHHIHKLDSPSGTALKLAESVAAGKGVDLAAAEIQFEVERRGEVPGDHSVIFASPTETLTFKHSVTTRQVFADGALRAARWAVAQQPPGWYQMHDVLFGDD
jgi:4-hydroxy-tetrahydrodipicolinate reductase